MHTAAYNQKYNSMSSILNGNKNSREGSRVPTDLLPLLSAMKQLGQVSLNDWATLLVLTTAMRLEALLRTKSHGGVLRPRANLAPRLRAIHPHR